MFPSVCLSSLICLGLLRLALSGRWPVYLVVVPSSVLLCRCLFGLVAAPGVNLWVRLARRPFVYDALYFQSREHRWSLQEYAALVAAAWRVG